MARFRRIAAFGAGSGLADLLSLKPDSVALVAVADNDVRRHGQSIAGVPVVAPDALAGLAVDAVIITAGAVDPIRAQLVGLGVDPALILPLCPSASRALLDHANADIRRLNEGLGIALPEAGLATMYLHSAPHAPATTAWPRDFVRNQMMALCADQIARRGVEGAVAELGVFRGDQAGLISRLFPGRRLHLFDTFAGFAESDLATERQAGFSAAATGDFSDTSIDLVRSKLAEPERALFHPGFFPATAEGVEDRFAFVSLDVDLHDPTLAGLEWFWPRLNGGGFIFVHDYNNARYNGVREAVDRFAQAAGVATLPIPDFSGSIVLAKP